MNRINNKKDFRGQSVNDRMDEIAPKVERVYFTPEVYRKIKETIGGRPAESGGLLLGFEKDLESAMPLVRSFIFDEGARTTPASYTFNTEWLNPRVKKAYNDFGLSVTGFIHSHPTGCYQPSGPDMRYFHASSSYMPRPYLITPIVFSEPDGGFRMFVYIVAPGAPARRVPYSIMSEKEYDRSAATISSDRKDRVNRSRIADAVDVDRLKNSKVVITGTGGMYCGADMLVRTGVGEMVAIDPDTVDSTNLCRQGYLPRQVEMKKVEALGEHLLEINPELNFSGYPVKLQELTPEQEEAIFGNADLAIFTTDSFDAQAYGNKIALRYGIPAIWGGFYEKSQAAEIFFFIPGVTPGCYRCAVSPRYKAQDEFKSQNGKEYSVSSNSNTIFHSAMLDAQIGMVAMAILHNDIEGKTFSGWFGDHWDRNLVQFKVSPDYKSGLFDRTFEGSGDKAFIFESVWQHIEPEIPPKYAPCPDCGGGNS